MTGRTELAHIRARLRRIPSEIGRAHDAGNIGLMALLYAEKALYLEVLESHSGTKELLALAQKEAAEALEKAGHKKRALEFYRKAFQNRGKIISYLTGKENTIKWQGDEIASLKGILASNPDEATRTKLEDELRRQGVMRPEERLRYEVNVEEVEKLIAELELQRRRTQQEAEFTHTQLNQVKRDLDKIKARIKHLEEELV